MHITCNVKNIDDCMKCREYFSFHSLHFDRRYNKHISSICCRISGNIDFKEDGSIYRKN